MVALGDGTSFTLGAQSASGTDTRFKAPPGTHLSVLRRSNLTWSISHPYLYDGEGRPTGWDKGTVSLFPDPAGWDQGCDASAQLIANQTAYRSNYDLAGHLLKQADDPSSFLDQVQAKLRRLLGIANAELDASNAVVLNQWDYDNHQRVTSRFSTTSMVRGLTSLCRWAWTRRGESTPGRATSVTRSRRRRPTPETAWG